MKRVIFLLIASTLVLSYTAVFAETTSSSDAAYWEMKKVDQQNKSTQMRKEYYEKYKAKGYDMSLLTSDLLDATQTDEAKFWEALKKVQNAYEIPMRRAHLDKMKTSGIDVSGFTEEIIADSGKFWKMVDTLQRAYSSTKEQKPVVETKPIMYEKPYVETTKPMMNDKPAQGTMNPEKKPDDSGKNNSNSRPPLTEKARKLFIERLDKIPADKLEVTLTRLKDTINRQIETATKNSNTLIVAKLKALLQIVEEKMTTGSDEALINSLFE
jgi:hypothetical protein